MKIKDELKIKNEVFFSKSFFEKFSVFNFFSNEFFVIISCFFDIQKKNFFLIVGIKLDQKEKDGIV